ncbi:MAG: MerR family transcriptional regulator, partial [Bacilli bacterium]
MKETEQLSIGQLAKRANVSVRTLQYYDQIDLLKPTAYNEGGRRLYRCADLTVLHQIFTMKTLGFSLEEIKHHIDAVDDVKSVETLLQNQATIFHEQIEQLQKRLQSVELLVEEIQTKNEIDWLKYATMLQSIQANSSYYWMIQHLDEEL